MDKLSHRLRRAKLVEEYNDQMFDEAADRIEELEQEVSYLMAYTMKLIGKLMKDGDKK
jgi:tetrahydromethanopterin S-methyltransferase subunit G